MMRPIRMLCTFLILCLCVFGVAWAEEETTASDKPTVVMQTSEGTIEIELWPDKAPITVKNFMAYVNKGFYDGTIIHRVVRGGIYVIQGGAPGADLIAAAHRHG